MPRLITTRCQFPISSEADVSRLENLSYDELVPSQSIWEVFSATAKLHGDRPALTVLGSATSSDVKVSLSHHQLFAEITRAANLFHDLGIRSDSVVAILARTHAQVPALLWGAECTGIVSNLNYLLSADAIAALLVAENAEVLVCASPELDGELWAKVLAVLGQSSSVKSVLVFGGLPSGTNERMIDFDALISDQPSGILKSGRIARRGDVAALFHTGGTTGLPKLVPQTHGNQIHAAWSFAQLFDISENDVGLNGFPLFHVGGTSTLGLSILAAGGHVVMLSPSGFRDPDVVNNIWRLCADFRATIIGGVPTSIGAMSEVKVSDNDLSALRFALTGGATLPTAVGERFEQRAGIPLLEQYGMTETVATIATTPFHGEHIRGSVGLRSPFSAIDIMEPVEEGNYRKVAVGSVGLVVARGPQVVAGYLDEKVNRSAYTPDGGLITGDLGYLDHCGYLHLTGREKDLIIRSGHNIDPGAIEEVANAHPAVALSAAVGIPDAYAGEIPVVFVVPAAGGNIDTAELQEFIAARIPEPPAKPRHVFVLDTIPVTGVGKIFKPALRELALAYKLRMEVAALQEPVDVINIEHALAKGQPVKLKLQARNGASITNAQSALETVLATLSVMVDIEWI